MESLVDGQWGPWGGYGSCSKSCGSGQKVRTRECNNPSPSHGGKGCIGSDREETICNTKGCPGNVMSYFTLFIHYNKQFATYDLPFLILIYIISGSRVNPPCC